eukprot:TRINITY_DN8536_c0_g1_i2.p1 TRINITY_DN8536_c0_g1~~TRINITY_DN8536_c0_g1_i2.p1  ORF type:complete len:392 (+),score=81.32 TRINITY_DN8536_c0_g1_i2:99-1274(+)
MLRSLVGSDVYKRQTLSSAGCGRVSGSSHSQPSLARCLLVLLVPLVAGNGVIVQIDSGRVRGGISGSCHAFYGIPYAKQRRFAPAVAAEPWSDIRDGSQDVFPECLQQPDAGAFGFHAGWIERAEEWLLPANMSEDCLFINVQTPSVRGSLPVMLYIHGGSYLSGSGQRNASRMCDQQIVYVSFNYRLGVLGNLALPQMLHESGTAGNWAIQDQRAAMQWVQRNIAQFGGDPSRVTIAGESAGAMAVYAHAALDRSQDLFSQAIAMSGNDDSLSLSESFAAGEEMVALVGCGGTQVVLDCLRNLPALDLVNLQTAVYNQSMRALQAPVADGFELAVGSTLKQRWLAGKIRHRLLVGHNVNDISLFLVLTLPELLASIKGDPVQARFTHETS